MASLGHLAVGLALGRLESGERSTAGRAWSMALLAGLAVLPDADVIAWRYGVGYDSILGHRGAAHSLAAALAVGLVAGLVARRLGAGFARGAKFAALAVASHGPLDMLTDGGGGIALLWPFTSERWFVPWRPIPVAPIGLDYLSREGLAVFTTELLYFAPLLAYALWRRKATAPAPARPPAE